MIIEFNKKNNKIIIASILIIIVLIISIIISITYKFKFYFSYNGIIVNEGGNYYVSCLLDDNEITKIKKTFLIYEKEQKNYEIKKIENEYILTETGPKRLIYMNIDLDEQDKINNNVVKLKFEYKTTLLEKFKEMFKWKN